jgi:hypothetical protein
MRPLYLITVMVMCFMACQKKVSPVDDNNNNTDSLRPDAIVSRHEAIGNTYYFDSIVFRYAAGRTDEVHYPSPHNFSPVGPVDSTIKSYHFDGAGKLTEISCPEGIFDPTGSYSTLATNMKFIYDAAGEISRINIQYSSHAPSTSWFTVSQQAGKYKVIMYDTSSSSPSKRTVYYTLNSDRYLEQDSTIFIGVSSNDTLSNNYTYDGNNNVTQHVQRSYGPGFVRGLATTNYTRFAVADPYEPVRKKSYANLANWFPFTQYFDATFSSFLNGEPAGRLINSYNKEEFIYILTSTEQYQSAWQSTIEMKDNKVSKRVSTLSTSFSETWTYTDKFYYR